MKYSAGGDFHATSSIHYIHSQHQIQKVSGLHPPNNIIIILPLPLPPSYLSFYTSSILPIPVHSPVVGKRKDLEHSSLPLSLVASVEQSPPTQHSCCPPKSCCYSVAAWSHQVHYPLLSSPPPPFPSHNNESKCGPTGRSGEDNRRLGQPHLRLEYCIFR